MSPIEDWPNAPPSADQRENISFHQQLIYKLASMETYMRESFRRLDEQFIVQKTEAHKREIASIERFNDIEKQQTVNMNDIQELKTWTRIVQARVAAIIGGVAVFWTLFGPFIQKTLGLE